MSCSILATRGASAHHWPLSWRAHEALLVVTICATFRDSSGIKLQTPWVCTMNLVAKARRGTLLSVGVPLPFSERLSSCSEDAGQASDPLIISDVEEDRLRAINRDVNPAKHHGILEESKVHPPAPCHFPSGMAGHRTGNASHENPAGDQPQHGSVCHWACPPNLCRVDYPTSAHGVILLCDHRRGRQRKKDPL